MDSQNYKYLAQEIQKELQKKFALNVILGRAGLKQLDKVIAQLKTRLNEEEKAYYIWRLGCFLGEILLKDFDVEGWIETETGPMLINKKSIKGIVRFSPMDWIEKCFEIDSQQSIYARVRIAFSLRKGQGKNFQQEDAFPRLKLANILQVSDEAIEKTEQMLITLSQLCQERNVEQTSSYLHKELGKLNQKFEMLCNEYGTQLEKYVICFLLKINELGVGGKLSPHRLIELPGEFFLRSHLPPKETWQVEEFLALLEYLQDVITEPNGHLFDRLWTIEQANDIISLAKANDKLKIISNLLQILNKQFTIERFADYYKILYLINSEAEIQALYNFEPQKSFNAYMIVEQTLHFAETKDLISLPEFARRRRLLRLLCIAYGKTPDTIWINELNEIRELWSTEELKIIARWIQERAVLPFYEILNSMFKASAWILQKLE